MTKKKNAKLNNAQTAKKDEFYTQLSDIEIELCHYKDFFKGKTILCNCNDTTQSNFFKYFVLNFNAFGLKKLIATSHKDSITKNHPYKVEITDVPSHQNGEEMPKIEELFKTKENKIEPLTQNGDFRTPECIKLLKESDIVITNPPFSLFREFIKTMLDYEKKFIILGSVNALTYKEIFPYIKDNIISLGTGERSGYKKFNVPADYPLHGSKCGVDDDGQKYIYVPGIRWFTNLDISKYHEDLDLTSTYDPKKYPKYDTYDAIEVSKTINIPKDYNGIMGVPITFLDKYNPIQFEIIGLDRYTVEKDKLTQGRLTVNGKTKYARILIKKRPKSVEESSNAL